MSGYFIPGPKNTPKSKLFFFRSLNSSHFMDGGRDVSLRPKKIKNTSAVLRAQVRILTTSFSLMLQQTTTTVVVVTYIIASLIGFRSLIYASRVSCFQPPTLIFANLSTFREKKKNKKKVVPKIASSFDEKHFFFFCFVSSHK
jgi:hypothetical protein